MICFTKSKFKLFFFFLGGGGKGGLALVNFFY